MISAQKRQSICHENLILIEKLDESNFFKRLEKGKSLI